MNAEAAPLFPGALTKPRTDTGPATLAEVRLGILDSACSDEELVRLVSEGEREALTLVFRRHASIVLSVARRVMRDDAEAEDLLQDVFLFVHQRASQFDPTKGSAISWIIQVTYHRALDRRKYLAARKHYGSLEFREELQGSLAAPRTIDQLASTELLNKFCAQLNIEQRQVLELHFFEGYTFHEIAGKTGQTLGNVRNHYYRGIERLRSLVFPKEARLK